MLLKKRKQLFYPKSYSVTLFVARYRKLLRISSVALRSAQRSILRRRSSARTKTFVPPYSASSVGPSTLKITLPYNSVLTAID